LFQGGKPTKAPPWRRDWCSARGGSPMECEMIGKYHETSCTFIPDTSPTLLASLCQEQRVSGLTASAPVSDVSAPACTNGVWPPLRPVSAAQKNKPSTMLSSNVQTIDLAMEYIVWQF